MFFLPLLGSTEMCVVYNAELKILEKPSPLRLNKWEYYVEYPPPPPVSLIDQGHFLLPQPRHDKSLLILWPCMYFSRKSNLSCFPQ